MSISQYGPQTELYNVASPASGPEIVQSSNAPVSVVSNEIVPLGPIRHLV